MSQRVPTATAHALDLHLEHLCHENTSQFSPLPSSQETFLKVMMEQAIFLSQDILQSCLSPIHRNPIICPVLLPLPL